MGYGLVQDILMLVGLGVITANIYRAMIEPVNPRIHWIIACFSVLLWTVCEALWTLESSVLIRPQSEYVYLNVSYLLPMFGVFCAVGVFLFIKFSNTEEKSVVLLDIVSVLLLVSTLSYSIVGDIDILKALNSVTSTAALCAMALNFAILFIVLSELFTSNLLYIRVSGFYLIVFGILFTMINLYVAYNKITIEDYDFGYSSLYMIPFIILMIGSFYLKTENKRVTTADIGLMTGSKWLPIIAVLPLLLQSDFGSMLSLLALFFLVSNALISYYIKSAMASKKMLEHEKILHQEMEKLVHERTNELMLANLRLQDISDKDYLTGLGSRSFLMNELKRASDELQANEELAVYYINISHFKAINASYGHEVGDKILKTAARRITGICNRQETTARIGADEFIVISKMELGSETKRMKFGISLKDAIEEPMQIDRYHFAIKCVIGIHIVTQKSKAEPRAIIKNADRAMYYAKENPASNPMVYNDEIDNKIHLDSMLEIALRKANLQKDFQMYFQPVFDLDTSRIVCAEALLRWYSKDYGLMEASDFMGIARGSGDILNTICMNATLKTIEHVSRWKKDVLNIPKISINVATTQSTSENFIHNFLQMTKNFGVSPRSFELEFCEALWMNPPEILDKIFELLKSNEIDVCIDDFGSGYTSLMYIRKYSINRLKIAADFVTQMAFSKIDAQIVAGIINLANSMKLTSAAKGVQDVEILDELRQLKCKEGQGYYLARPMSAEEFEEFLRQNPQIINAV
ncbi:putative bifunctional diguanylate cyclase/phosphodiesterase [Campylobacter curvus]|uniref:putative bifunctional diguanylate cyclase/phosphodiesterase n=1 Tax=Campylobacter curvus TaxID=200 RepID=UPI001470038F|nr:EAL domain-containing protein [Campylobacter curvus]